MATQLGHTSTTSTRSMAALMPPCGRRVQCVGTFTCRCSDRCIIVASGLDWLRHNFFNMIKKNCYFITQVYSPPACMCQTVMPVPLWFGTNTVTRLVNRKTERQIDNKPLFVYIFIPQFVLIKLASVSLAFANRMVATANEVIHGNPIRTYVYGHLSIKHICPNGVLHRTKFFSVATLGIYWMGPKNIFLFCQQHKKKPCWNSWQDTVHSKSVSCHGSS